MGDNEQKKGCFMQIITESPRQIRHSLEATAEIKMVKWRRDIGCKRYQWPVLKMTTSWKAGASAHLLSGTSMSTRYPSLYPRDSSTPPLALGDHLCKGKQLFYKCFENVNRHLTAALKKS